MDRELLVYVDLDEGPVLAGTLWSRVRRGRESASFEYSPGWRGRRDAFALDPPLLPLGPGTFHTRADLTLFNALADGAPDRWGRALMRRTATRRGEARPLFDVDYLTRVDDESRQGAYRYRESADAGFLTSEGATRIPPLVELPRLLGAANRVLDESDTEEDLRLLLAPGSSLGGARPKASVRDADGSLLIAKFPRQDDDLPVNEWEHTALVLARRAGITASTSRLETVGSLRVVIHQRFDRRGRVRVPFVSALTLLDASDNQARSYLEIADAIRQVGASVKVDLEELWRRLVFNVLIANTDDHLRNHGFLWAGNGWRLSPAYDLNPTPIDIRPRVLSLAIDENDPTGSIDLAMSVAGHFDLDSSRATAVLGEVQRAVRSYRDVARSVGLTGAELSRMQSAFEGAS